MGAKSSKQLDRSKQFDEAKSSKDTETNKGKNATTVKDQEHDQTSITKLQGQTATKGRVKSSGKLNEQNKEAPHHQAYQEHSREDINTDNKVQGRKINNQTPNTYERASQSSITSKKQIKLDDIKTANGINAIVAIDFGTTQSGYAYCLMDNDKKIYTPDPEREPTVILLNPEKEFDSFGDKAQQKYNSMTTSERERYLYIENFKMALYKSKILKKTSLLSDKENLKVWKTMTSQTPPPVDVIDIFTMAIKHLKTEAVKTLKMKILGLVDEQIAWVITIPAIWTDSAKQLMRMSAGNAGIPEERLRLVLEPEAASLYSRSMEKVATATGLEKLPPGHKYIIADLGGGTADICVHEIIEDHNLKEIYRATGGDYGGNCVNESFAKFMSELATPTVWEEFKMKHPQFYSEMWSYFEQQKKEFKKINLVLRLEPCFLKLLHKHGMSLEEELKKQCDLNDAYYDKNNERLTISGKKFESFFKYSIDGITESLDAIFFACKDIETLILVGGFARSTLVQEHLKAKFSSKHLKFIVDRDPHLAVLKGAVMMGYEARTVIQRVARHTYGVLVQRPFKKGKHREEFLVSKGGKRLVDNVFELLIRKGDILTSGDTFSSIGHNEIDSFVSDIELITEVWRSDEMAPCYCTEKDGCVKVGQIIRKPPSYGWPTHLDCQTQFIVGETEFTVREIDMDTGKNVEATIDFL